MAIVPVVVPGLLGILHDRFCAGQCRSGNRISLRNGFGGRLGLGGPVRGERRLVLASLGCVSSGIFRQDRCRQSRKEECKGSFHCHAHVLELIQQPHCNGTPSARYCFSRSRFPDASSGKRPGGSRRLRRKCIAHACPRSSMAGESKHADCYARQFSATSNRGTQAKMPDGKHGHGSGMPGGIPNCRPSAGSRAGEIIMSGQAGIRRRSTPFPIRLWTIGAAPDSRRAQCSFPGGKAGTREASGRWIPLSCRSRQSG